MNADSIILKILVGYENIYVRSCIISYGCHNKSPKSRQLKTAEIYSDSSGD